MDSEGGSLVDRPLFHSMLPAAIYRPIVIFCIGLWGWGLNLYLLHKMHIDTPTLLQFHTAEPPFRSIFSIATILTILVLSNMWLFWATSRSVTWLPVLCYATALGTLLWPGKGLYKKEREKFLRLLKRLFSIFASVYFADIIMADILTSFSNVFGDLFTTGCSAIFLGRSCQRDILVPLLISIPYLIRLRQCLFEYFESGGECKRHLFNALKYTSAFPVIIISATQKKADQIIAATGSVPSSWWISDTRLFQLWIFFVLINSMYSFWWDIAMDWSLINITMTPSIHHRHHHYHQQQQQHQQPPLSTNTPLIRFRKELHFNDPIWYYGAMIIDFLLRTTWSLKLSSHLYVKRLEGSIFVMELLEVIRRWVWVIFRLESEWVKRAHATLPSSNHPVDSSDMFHMETLNGSPSKLMTIREEEEDLRS